MPTHYNISSELNMIIYSCEGLITGSELLKTAKIAYHDKRRRYGMISVIDLLSATVDFELEDLYQFISWTNDLKTKGFEPEKIAVLTQNKGIHLTSEALSFMSSKVSLKLNVFYTLEEAITSMGLSELLQEIIRFWKESKSLSEKSQSISTHENTGSELE